MSAGSADAVRVDCGMSPGGLYGSTAAHAGTEHRHPGHAAPVKVAHRREHVPEKRVGLRAHRGASVAAEVEGYPRPASHKAKGAQLALSKAAPGASTTASEPRAA